jgi:hypothetical protein
MNKMCLVVVAAVAIIGLSAAPAAAATYQPSQVPRGWICEQWHICVD